MAISEWVYVGDPADVEESGVLRVEVNGVPIAIWNVEGTFYATQDTCTHEEASLSEGDLWGDVVECPLHGAMFDVTTGEVLGLPAVLPLATYPVKVEGDSLYVGWNEER